MKKLFLLLAFASLAGALNTTVLNDSQCVYGVFNGSDSVICAQTHSTQTIQLTYGGYQQTPVLNATVCNALILAPAFPKINANITLRGNATNSSYSQDYNLTAAAICEANQTTITLPAPVNCIANTTLNLTAGEDRVDFQHNNRFYCQASPRCDPVVILPNGVAKITNGSTVQYIYSDNSTQPASNWTCALNETNQTNASTFDVWLKQGNNNDWWQNSSGCFAASVQQQQPTIQPGLAQQPTQEAPWWVGAIVAIGFLGVVFLFLNRQQPPGAATVSSGEPLDVLP